MASSQKVLLIAIFFNLFISSMIFLADNDSANALNQITLVNDKEEGTQQATGNENGLYNSMQGATTIMNDILDPVMAGMRVLWLFVRGIIPFSLMPSATYTTIENILITGILLFRCALTAIIGLELFMIWRNRKTSS